jgi:hypothetical protein
VAGSSESSCEAAGVSTGRGSAGYSRRSLVQLASGESGSEVHRPVVTLTADTLASTCEPVMPLPVISTPSSCAGVPSVMCHLCGKMAWAGNTQCFI